MKNPAEKYLIASFLIVVLTTILLIYSYFIFGNITLPLVIDIILGIICLNLIISFTIWLFFEIKNLWQ